MSSASLGHPGLPVDSPGNQNGVGEGAQRKNLCSSALQGPQSGKLKSSPDTAIGRRFSGNERVVNAKHCQLQQHYPGLESFQEAAHTSRHVVPGNFQGRLGIQMSRLPEARPHSVCCLLGGPSSTNLYRPAFISIPKIDRLWGRRTPAPPPYNSEQCKANSVSLAEICPFKDFPSPGGTESI